MASLGVAARSAAFSPDGELLAVGLKNGAFVLLKAPDLTIVAQKRDRHKAIQDVRLMRLILITLNHGIKFIYNIRDWSTLLELAA